MTDVLVVDRWGRDESVSGGRRLSARKAEVMPPARVDEWRGWRRTTNSALAYCTAETSASTCTNTMLRSNAMHVSETTFLMVRVQCVLERQCCEGICRGDRLLIL